MKRITKMTKRLAARKAPLWLGSFFMGLTALSTPSHAAGDAVLPPRIDWSFQGPFGIYDQAQLQRGFKIYREVCSACHSAKKLAFRNLAQTGGPAFSEAQIKALAANYKVTDGPNDKGEMFERDARPADRWPSPFPNELAARAANGGAYPPDFSVLAKARGYSPGFPKFITDAFTQEAEYGVDYIAALLTGYKEAPQGFKLQAGQYYNTYMPGNVISMAAPLSDGLVEYPKDEAGKPIAPETKEQYAKDVSAFMMWMAEPHLNQRKTMGFRVMLFLLVFAGLLYFTKKRVWSRAHDEASHV
jgi:ubiquinol-cytochrome c reductase cytochrome c1 subunit